MAPSGGGGATPAAVAVAAAAPAAVAAPAAAIAVAVAAAPGISLLAATLVSGYGLSKCIMLCSSIHGTLALPY